MAQLSHVLEICRKPKDLGVGSRFRQTSRTLGIRFPMLLEVIEYEPNRRIALKSVAGAVDFHNERRFDPTDTGTRVTFIGNVGPGISASTATTGPAHSASRVGSPRSSNTLRLLRALRLVEPLAVRFSGGQVDRDLEAVKRRLEATSP